MPKRNPKKVVSVKQQADSAAALRKALARQSKAQLVDLLLEMACKDRAVFRQLTIRFDVAASPDELLAVARQAIVDATDFDERDINRNFAYDYEAYGEIKRNLDRLIQARQLPLAMQLSLELMQAGSRQVEMSDEGLMTEDIEDCLSVVIKALQKGQLPAQQVIAWCMAMLKSDRVGCIAGKQLQDLLQVARVHYPRSLPPPLSSRPPQPNTPTTPRPPIRANERSVFTHLPAGHDQFAYRSKIAAAASAIAVVELRRETLAATSCTILNPSSIPSPRPRPVRRSAPRSPR